MPEERPYAFISYSHRDSDQVMPVLDRLKRRDVAVWYDQGIEVGSEWPEFIAQALVGARCVIAFITPNSVASQNCRREINFAISKGIDVVAAYLEPTDLSPGMELQLNTLQALYRENYPDEDAFVEALMAARVLEPCIGAAREADAPAGGVSRSEDARGGFSDGDAKADEGAESPVSKGEASVSSDFPLGKRGSEASSKASGSAASERTAVAEGVAAGKTALGEGRKAKPAKKLLAALLALAVIVGCCVGGVYAFDVSRSKTFVDEAGSLVDGKGNIYSRPFLIGDADLVGNWKVISVEDRGSAKCGAYEGGILGFTFEGTYFGNMFQPDGHLETTYAVDPTGSVNADSDGQLASAQMDASIGEGDFTWAYRMSDFTDEMLDTVGEDERKFLATGEKNLLTIQVTGTCKEDTAAVREVDSTIVLARKSWNWSDGYLMQDTLPGSWDDNFGNTWTFATSKVGASTFSLTTVDGGEFEDGSVGCSAENDYSREYLVFSFDDPSTIAGEQVIKGYIRSVGYSQIVLEQTDGTQLVFTRSEQEGSGS